LKEKKRKNIAKKEEGRLRRAEPSARKRRSTTERRAKKKGRRARVKGKTEGKVDALQKIGPDGNSEKKGSCWGETR